MSKRAVSLAGVADVAAGVQLTVKPEGLWSRKEDDKREIDADS
jgi:hypothetical protein